MNMNCILPVAALLASLLPAQNGQDPAPAAPATQRAARLSGGGAPQGKSQEALIKLREEKLAKEVFKKAPWMFDFDKARETAKKEGKLIFTYFTRSYAG
ncbi:MAG: hypothetical protein RL148_2133 [Planctomycetota bacterium]|jgi:hypothetical protein